MGNIKTHKVGIIMNGVTGRMGSNQHLMRSIVEIIRQGGVKVSPDEVIMPDPILVGSLSDPYNPANLERLSKLSGIEKYSTDVEGVLANPDFPVYFDSQSTTRRFEWVSKAIAANKHVYCEKPSALTKGEAYKLYVLAQKAGVKHGIVQDKLWLPGILKLKMLIDTGFFGRILSVRGEFGYWVFEGNNVQSQRPSWNYRKEDGGGIIIDMFPHWSYLLENLFGKVKAVCCHGATHIKKRWDENGNPYECTADDAAYATFELDEEIIAHFNCSWATRVKRDDLLTIQVDGTKGSAVAGLRNCFIQSSAATPRPVWNPDVESPIDYSDEWTLVPDHQEYDNAFKLQWEMFLRYIVKDLPFRWNLLEGAKGVQLAEKGYESWEKRSCVDIPELKSIPQDDSEH